MDLVVGVQWLKSLGPVLTNYATLTMKFMNHGRLVKLRGDRENVIHDVTHHQLRHMIQSKGVSALFHIRLTEPDLPSNQTTRTSTQLLDIDLLLQRYVGLFQNPSTLPPTRQINLTINLVPNLAPIRVRPYRYPHFLKQEIELQVTNMLRSGIIRLSQSPFSSPILLVKKRDGLWPFCVDYRALNAITVKDSFLIPTIDELLDELGGAC